MIKNGLVCKLRTLGDTTVAFWLKRLYLVFEKWSERVQIEFWKDFDTRCRWLKLWLAGWLEVIHLWTFVYINNRLSWWARPWLVSRGQSFFEIAISPDSDLYFLSIYCSVQRSHISNFKKVLAPLWRGASQAGILCYVCITIDDGQSDLGMGVGVWQIVFLDQTTTVFRNCFGNT